MGDLSIINRLTVISKLHEKAVVGQLNGLRVGKHHMVLYVINQSKQQLTQEQISGMICVNQSTMVQIIDHLVQSGFVNRLTNPKNRRQNLISLTKKGYKNLFLINSAYKKVDEFSFKDISKEEVKIFKQSLNIMLENLKTMTKD